MLLSSVPTKFVIPFAFAAGAGFTRPVPTASQIGINPGFASLTDGFPPLCFTPIGAGGVPPYGADFNGLLNQITLWNQWQSAGGPILWDSAFASSIAGGYPKGAIVGSNIVLGNQWMSTADNNTSNPDTGGANWVQAPNTLGTGFCTWTPFSTVPTGWVPLKSSYTIGSASSGANYAAADAALLYADIWNGFSNSQCPVTGGRGANAAADFAANKPMQVPSLSGTSIMGLDNGTGLLTNVPVVSGSINVTGSIIGENLHALITAELAAHNHSYSDPTHDHLYVETTGTNSHANGAAFAADTVTPNIHTSGSTVNITINNNGSGTAHNNVERSMVGTFVMHL